VFEERVPFDQIASSITNNSPSGDPGWLKKTIAMSEVPSVEKESKYHSWWTVPLRADRQLLSIGMRGSDVGPRYGSGTTTLSNAQMDDAKEQKQEGCEQIHNELQDCCGLE